METAIVTASIAAGTSLATILVIKPWVDRKIHIFQLRQNFKAEQIKKIKNVFAEHKNKLLKAGEKLNNRLKNFAKNHQENWHSVSGNYTVDTHYLDTTVYHFLSFFANIQLIEKQLIHLDTTISDKSDLRTIKFFRLFHDVMCDVDLFEKFQLATDHFFSTPFENFSNNLIENNEVINLDKFMDNKPLILDKIKPIYAFIDGMSPSENRLRLERLKIFHLSLIAFMNEFGYDYQKNTTEKNFRVKDAHRRL